MYSYSRKLAEYLNICKRSRHPNPLVQVYLFIFHWVGLKSTLFIKMCSEFETMSKFMSNTFKHTFQALLFDWWWWWRQRQPRRWRWPHRLRRRQRQTRQGPLRAHAARQAEARLTEAAAQGKGVVPETLNFILGWNEAQSYHGTCMYIMLYVQYM